MTKLLDGIVLSDFVTILLGNSEWQHCPLYIAEKIQEVDTDNQYTFVELPNALNGLDRPKVWNIKDWKQSYERLQKRRQLSELENKVHAIYSECRNRALVHLVKLTGLESKDLLSGAVKIAQGRVPEAMLNMGITQHLIRELAAADLELLNYKKKIGMR